jgi:hypothetical protein
MDTRVMEAAFLDELEKIAASLRRLNIPKTRVGRRPISVAKFLAKDQAGHLFRKHAGVSSYTEGYIDPGAYKKPRKKGEVPSKEDNEIVTRQEDGREMTATTPPLGNTFNNLTAFGNTAAGL